MRLHDERNSILAKHIGWYVWCTDVYISIISHTQGRVIEVESYTPPQVILTADTVKSVTSSPHSPQGLSQAKPPPKENSPSPRLSTKAPRKTFKGGQTRKSLSSLIPGPSGSPRCDGDAGENPSPPQFYCIFLCLKPKTSMSSTQVPSFKKYLWRLKNQNYAKL
ncbi:hypothetical protein AVEN_226826-1 [Araneus ventricosus]|uniref:Uncharacterized protein n=1 Tax=Araneus ventricosus TaxID=182803 RepID=A0A4Y2TIW9_ARAVE|nr:hypothetical protein AVEN_226826-1 [Araneus ventricosus]